MKDKSRLLSSVIVSLLAGFIYYQFGDNIQEKFQNSFKAVLSSNNMEEYLPQNCEPFNSLIAKAETKSKMKKSKFYIKKNFRNTIEFKTTNLTVPGEEFMSEFIASNQARFQRPQADKKIDFTQELENLIKSNLEEIQNNDFKINSSTKKSSNEVADLKATRHNNIVIIKDFVKTKGSEKVVHSTGYGFEYNYVTEESLSKTKSNSGKESGSINGNNHYNSSSSESNSKCTKTKIEYKTKIINGKEVKVIAPKINLKVNDESIEVDVPEINIEDEELYNQTM